MKETHNRIISLFALLFIVSACSFFSGKQNTPEGYVRTFGTPTAGYASANIVKALADGYTLLITTSCDMARTGEIFCDAPIEPDVLTQTPLKDAVAWIATTSQKVTDK